jgi:FkbM family methyltransferase
VTDQLFGLEMKITTGALLSMISKLFAMLGSRSRNTDGAIKDSPLRRYVDSRFLLPSASLVRLGTSYGGWLIPAAPGLTGESVCYLAGAGEDISFDCALAQRFHCNIRVIDPTPRAVQHFMDLKKALKEGRRFPINNSQSEFYEITATDLARMKFLPIGLADQDADLKFYLPKNSSHVSCSTVNLQKTKDFFTAKCHRLRTVMAQQSDEVVDLIKMDIEGAEYSVIRDILASGLLPRILLIEFDEAHTPLDSDAGSRIADHVRQLAQAGMRCIAVEGSNATFVRGW